MWNTGIVCLECNLILILACKAISQARTDGNHYPVDFWKTDPRDNIEHARVHLQKFTEGDTTEAHIAHAICTLVFQYAKHS